MCNGIGFCFESQSATAVFSYRALDFFLGVVTESGFVFGSRDGIGFCFGVSRRDRFFLGRAFVPVVFLTTESVFVLGVHDEMPFCFGGSRRDAVLFWGFVTRCHFVFGVRDE